MPSFSFVNVEERGHRYHQKHSGLLSRMWEDILLLFLSKTPRKRDLQEPYLLTYTKHLL